MSQEEKKRRSKLAEAKKIGWRKACQEGDLATIEILLSDEEPDINGDHSELYLDSAQGCITGAPYYTPLGEAARFGRVEVVKRLLEAGASVNRPNYRSETALHEALARNQAATTRLLLEAGADPNLTGCLGNAISATHGQLALIEMLLEYGADPTVRDFWGQHSFTAFRFDLEDIEDNDDKKRAKQMLRALERLETIWPKEHVDYEALCAFVHEAREGLGNLDIKSKKQKKRYEALGQPSKGWEKKIEKILSGDLLKSRKDIDLLVKYTLSQEATIAAPSWGSLVLQLAEKTVDYGDTTEEIYGERLYLEEMDGDEGGILDMISDERLCTAGDVFTLLAHPAASLRADFAELFEKTCTIKKARLGSAGFGEDELEALLASPSIHKREDIEHLRMIAQKAYPFLSIPS